jgi:hypothetical protein
MDNINDLKFFMDETSAPYSDNENHFVVTKEDELFDEAIIAKYHLIIEKGKVGKSSIA